MTVKRLRRKQALFQIGYFFLFWHVFYFSLSADSKACQPGLTGNTRGGRKMNSCTEKKAEIFSGEQQAKMQKFSRLLTALAQSLDSRRTEPNKFYQSYLDLLSSAAQTFHPEETHPAAMAEANRWQQIACHKFFAEQLDGLCEHCHRHESLAIQARLIFLRDWFRERYELLLQNDSGRPCWKR